MSESNDWGKMATVGAYESGGVSPERIISLKYKFGRPIISGVSIVFATSELIHKITLDCQRVDNNVEEYYNFREPQTISL